MSRYIPVEGYPDLIRDASTNLILNINSSRIEEAKTRRDLKQKKEKQQELLAEKVNNLETEMTEIKTLLKQIAEKL